MSTDTKPNREVLAMRRLYLVTTSAGVCIPVRGYRAALRLAACLNVPASIIRWKLARR